MATSSGRRYQTSATFSPCPSQVGLAGPAALKSALMGLNQLWVLDGGVVDSVRLRSHSAWTVKPKGSIPRSPGATGFPHIQQSFKFLNTARALFLQKRLAHCWCCRMHATAGSLLSFVCRRWLVSVSARGRSNPRGWLCHVRPFSRFQNPFLISFRLSR